MRSEEWWPASAPHCSYGDIEMYCRVRFYMLAEICKQLAVNSICIPPDKRLLSNRFHFFTNRMNPPKARLLKVINGYGISDSFITFYTPF